MRSSAALARVRARGKVYQVAIVLAGRGLVIPVVVVVVVAVALVLTPALEARVAGAATTPAETVVVAQSVAVDAVDPTASLTAAAAADAGAAEHLMGSWVPQVASGPFTDAAAYWPVHQDLVSRFGAVLITTDEFVFQGPGFWVDVVPMTFTTGADALAWCASMGRGNRDCYAKLLTRDQSVTVTTMHQR
jgi:hypothetical protein